MEQLAIINGSVYLDRRFQKTNVYVQDGVISRITPDLLPAWETVDAASLFVIPGLIDPHVHLSLNTAHAVSADTYESGSIAAAYGGITTMIDFLDEAATVAEMDQRLWEKQEVAKGSYIDFALHAAVRELVDDADQMAEKALSLGMPTIKLYTTYRPDSYSSPRTVEAMIRRSAKGDVLILCHSEKDDMLDLETGDISCHGKNRPPASEVEEVRDIANWVRQYGGYAYIVHTSCGSTVEMLQEEYPDILGSHLYLESCPQYFLFDDAVYAGPDARLYTMTPPIRPLAEQALLRKNWEAIHSFATDHCPFMTAEKAVDSLHKMPMGCGGIEQSFKVLHPLFGDNVIDRFTENTARIHGLYPKKGVIREGSDADLVLYRLDPDVPFANHSASDYSLYQISKRDIDVISVLSRGIFVIKNGQLQRSQGQYVERTISSPPVFGPR